MATDPQEPRDGELEGEGSYSGARDYNKRTKAFIEREGDDIEDMARDAEEALDGAEGDDLSRAEAAGKARAKGKDDRWPA